MPLQDAHTRIVAREQELEQEIEDLTQQLREQKLREQKLEQEIEDLAQKLRECPAMRGGMNATCRRILQEIHEEPKTISELAEILAKENRIISQWLYQLKSRFGVEIVTLHDGRKMLANPETFTTVLRK